MWGLTASYLLALVLHATGWTPSWDGWFGALVDGWLGLLPVWAPAAVCWLAAYRVRHRRLEVVLAAAAVTSYALGDTYYLTMTVSGGSLPFPSLADVGYLLVYPLLFTALTLLVRRQGLLHVLVTGWVRRLGGPVWS